MEKTILGIQNDLFYTLLGAIIGIVLVYLLKIVAVACNHFRNLKYQGFYISRIKTDNKAYYFLKVTVCINELRIKGISIKEESGKFIIRHTPIVGVIELGRYLKTMGEGGYRHFEEDSGLIRAGEYRIQVVNRNTIIATQLISEDDNKQSCSRYIWKKVNKQDKEIKELFRMFKEQFRKKYFA